MNSNYSLGMEHKGVLRILTLDHGELAHDDVLGQQLDQLRLDVEVIRSASALNSPTDFRWPDILVIDDALPDTDGFALIRELRARSSGVGIIMLTAQNAMSDSVRGLSEGADACLAKPIDKGLFAATVGSMTRRMRTAQPSTTPSAWRLGDDGWHLLHRYHGSVRLTKSESRVLSTMFEKPNQATPREELIATLTHDVHGFDPHRLESLIYRLRKKVHHLLGVALPLNAVHREGYVFVLDGHEHSSSTPNVANASLG